LFGFLCWGRDGERIGLDGIFDLELALKLVDNLMIHMMKVFEERAC
jgi:hypothetical protein